MLWCRSALAGKEDRMLNKKKFAIIASLAIIIIAIAVGYYLYVQNKSSADVSVADVVLNFNKTEYAVGDAVKATLSNNSANYNIAATDYITKKGNKIIQSAPVCVSPACVSSDNKKISILAGKTSQEIIVYNKVKSTDDPNAKYTVKVNYTFKLNGKNKKASVNKGFTVINPSYTAPTPAAAPTAVVPTAATSGGITAKILSGSEIPASCVNMKAVGGTKPDLATCATDPVDNTIVAGTKMEKNGKDGKSFKWIFYIKNIGADISAGNSFKFDVGNYNSEGGCVYYINDESSPYPIVMLDKGLKVGQTISVSGTEEWCRDTVKYPVNFYLQINVLFADKLSIEEGNMDNNVYNFRVTVK